MERVTKNISATLLLGALLTLPGCIKDKYDFNKLSTRAEIQPQWTFPVVNGSLVMGNMVTPNDTVVFDSDNSVKIVYREDSIFTYRASQVLNIPDQAIETLHFPLGAYQLDDFFYSGTVSLDQMAQNFNPALYSQLQSLNGTTSPFPPIPSSGGGSYNMTPFPNFTQVTFSSGTLNLTVGNNLPVDLDALVLRIKRTSDGTPVGNDLDFGTIPSGGNSSQSMDLAGLTVPNDLTFEIVTVSSPGSGGTPVPIDLQQGLSVDVASANVMVVSGNAILPSQVFFSDTDNYNLNIDTVQLAFLRIHTGEIEYNITSPLSEPMFLHMTLPTGRRGGDTLKYDIQVSKKKSLQAILSLDSAAIDLSTIPAQPYNILPFKYSVELVSSGNFVTFNLADSITFSYQLKNISFQYVRGYFGQHHFQVNNDSVDVGIDEFFKDIKGTISLTNPKVKLLYSNGFGIPARASIDVVGKTNTGGSQALNAPPIDILYPADPAEVPVDGEIVLDRNNTDIVQLIDLHPATVVYSGSAMLNPDGFQGLTNFVSLGSAIVGDLEVEVPLEFRIQNLELTDTMDNPLEEDTSATDFGLKDLDYAKLYVNVSNGFPVGIDFKVYMYDSINNVLLDSIIIDQVFEAAPVDNRGKSTQPAEGVQTVDLGKTDLDYLSRANQLIVRALFNSSNNGSVDVKIYTDYTLDFSLGFSASAKLDL